MLTGTDQVKVLSLDLVHHGIHLCKAHNAGNHIAADHERRYAVSKSSVDHEIAGIGNYCRMQSGNIAHQIIKSVSGYTSCSIQVDTVKAFHDFCMIRNFEIRYHRLTKLFDLHIVRIILADRYRRINNIRNGHHDRTNALFNLFLTGGKFLNTVSKGSNLFFNCFCFLKFLLSHQSTDLLGHFISLRTKILYFLLDLTIFLIKINNLVYQRQLGHLKFVFDILLYHFRVFTYKANV